MGKEFEENKYLEKIQGKSGNDIYGVYHRYEADSSKPFSYFIGCKVFDLDIIPENMQSLIIPTGVYYKIMAKGKMPKCVIDAWRRIWDMDIPRAYTIDFEVFDERSRDWNDGEVDVYLALKEEPQTIKLS